MADLFDKPWSGVETAGRLCLSLVNTQDWRRRETPDELLLTFSDLIRWARTAGVLTTSEARALRAHGDSHPRTARRVLGETVRLREAIASVFLAACAGERLPAGGLKRLDHVCRAAHAARSLRPAGDAVVWGWRRATPEPERPMWAAALDASEILTSAALERVRQCGDAECGWMFLDASKNRSRRWCTMESCGNRNKARSFYRRSTGRGRAGTGMDR